MIDISYEKNNKGKPVFKCYSDGKEIYVAEKQKGDYELYKGYIDWLNEKFKDISLKNGKELRELGYSHIDEYFESIGEDW